MKLWQRNGIWFVGFHTKFGYKTINTKQTDRALAEQVVKEARIEQIELSRTINLVANAASMHALCGRIVTSKEAFTEWLANLNASRKKGTAFRYEKVVRFFLREIGWPKVLSEIRAPQIDGWINNTEECDSKAETRKVHRAGLNNFFKYCENEGWCANPVANVRVKRHLLTHEQNESTPRRPFTPEEFERLIEVAKKEQMPFWYGALMVARYTGLRWGDVISMETACIHPDHIVVWTDKRDRRVSLPMPPELPPVFDLLAKHPFNQPMSSTPPGRVFNQIPVEVWQTNKKEFGRLLRAAKIEGHMTIHCIRHTYATELAKSGLPLKEIAKRMGHFGDGATLNYLRSLVQ